ncbi:hypothetical protein IAQ61_002366 [Plenodomus lingam]|uniref:uncharacterized protein n=1 Tax=Leptosphaeria maculans TaxID=5022 RepID=UPI003320A52B|nr:hypothetical protein IAQ61_002366 [Plenodomus lingam]
MSFPRPSLPLTVYPLGKSRVAAPDPFGLQGVAWKKSPHLTAPVPLVTEGVRMLPSSWADAYLKKIYMRTSLRNRFLVITSELDVPDRQPPHNLPKVLLKPSALQSQLQLQIYLLAGSCPGYIKQFF